MNLVFINTESQTETSELLNKRLFAIKNQRMGGDVEELALIIDGRSLTFALEKECSGVFLELAVMCKAVICCESSNRRVPRAKLIFRPSLAPSKSPRRQACQAEYESAFARYRRWRKRCQHDPGCACRSGHIRGRGKP